MEREPIAPLLTGREGGEIDPNLAVSWTKNYRDRHPGETISQFFGREVLEKVLSQENCLGIRFYYANDKPLNGWQRFIVAVSNFLLKVLGNVDGEKHLVMAGAVASGMDQLPTPLLNPIGDPLAKTELKAFTSTQKSALYNQSMPCPGRPSCPTNVVAGS